VTSGAGVSTTFSTSYFSCAGFSGATSTAGSGFLKVYTGISKNSVDS